MAGLDINNMELSAGKRTRLYRLRYQFGPGNGAMMVLPVDQGMEHGPADFFENPESEDPVYEFRLAEAGGFSAVAIGIGLSEKYVSDFAGRVPLIVKLNGRTNIPADKAPLSPLNASVEDAVRLGADAVGYTLYVGSGRQDEDFSQFRQVRQDAHRFGMPVIVWAYPRGEFVEAKGGKDSLFAIDYAARVAQELGADVVKLNYPDISPQMMAKCPAPYNSLKLTPEDAMKKIVSSAGRTFVILSGGSKMPDEKLLERVRVSLQAGIKGFIFGRNVWQRKFEDALELSQRIKNEIQKQAASTTDAAPV